MASKSITITQLGGGGISVADTRIDYVDGPVTSWSTLWQQSGVTHEVVYQGGFVEPERGGGEALPTITVPRGGVGHSSTPTYTPLPTDPTDEVIGAFVGLDPRFEYELGVYEEGYLAAAPLAYNTSQEASTGKYVSFDYYESDRPHPGTPIVFVLTVLEP